MDIFLPRKFLPSPVPIVQSSDGLRAATGEEPQLFPSMFVLNSVNIKDLLPKSLLVYKTIPHDLYCPSLKSALKDRICSSCGLYFASQVMLNDHKKVHNVSSSIKKVRPIRIAAKRQRELMAVIARDHQLDCEWLDEDEVDSDELPPLNEKPLEFPTVNRELHMQSPWKEIDK